MIRLITCYLRTVPTPDLYVLDASRVLHAVWRLAGDESDVGYPETPLCVCVCVNFKTGQH